MPRQTPSPPARNAAAGSRPDVAFLVYRSLRQRRKDDTYDGNDNIGGKVVADVLERSGIRVGYCTPETAHEHPLVLVSLTSTADVHAYYRAVVQLPSWQPGRRQHRVLAGGFGMQNPTALRHWIDWAAFGRVEDWIIPVVEAVLGGGRPPDHPGLMHLPDLHPVRIQQASRLYPHRVGWWQEEFTGCPLKCKFCHYTYARRHQGTDGAYVQTMLSDSMPELTWDQVATYPQKAGRIRAAIDGTSMRLRYLYGKRIADDDIVRAVERIGRYGPGATTLLVYNIGGMPTETRDDWESLYATLRRCRPRHQVIFVLHTTPFRPSAATPMQWEAADLSDLSRLREQTIVRRDAFYATHSYTIETPWSHLLSLVAERATPTPECDRLMHAISCSPRLRRGRDAEKLALARREYDLSPYVREYDPEEAHPTWFLDGWMPREQMVRMARRMREQARRSIEEPGWIPGHGSMVEYAVRRQSLAMVE